MELKVEPPQYSPVEQPYAWPWVGVLANIPLQCKNCRFVGLSGFILKQHLSHRGFNPLKVDILWTHRGHSGFALVEFQKDYNGLQHATLFDMSFQESRCGNKDWNNAMIVPEVKLYGWVAREDDYKFEGIVGHHLRKFRDLNNSAFLYKRMRHNEMHSQVHGFSSCVDGFIKHKDEMLQSYHKGSS